MRLPLVLLNAGTTGGVMEKFGHTANKRRAFIESRFLLSSASNLGFWSSDYPYTTMSKYPGGIFKICAWHLQHFKQVEL